MFGFHKHRHGDRHARWHAMRGRHGGFWGGGLGEAFEEGFGGFGGGRGGGRGRRKMFDGAELRLILLALIGEQPRHGYDLIKAIEERSGGAYAPSPGVVYPTITMPTFGAENIGDDGSARVVERTVQVIDRDGTVQPIGVAELLAPLHSGPASLTLDRLLKPSADGGAEPSSETVAWLKRQTEQSAITPDPIGLQIIWQPTKFDVRSLTRTHTGRATVRELRW